MRFCVLFLLLNHFACSKTQKSGGLEVGPASGNGGGHDGGGAGGGFKVCPNGNCGTYPGDQLWSCQNSVLNATYGVLIFQNNNGNLEAVVVRNAGAKQTAFQAVYIVSDSESTTATDVYTGADSFRVVINSVNDSTTGEFTISRPEITYASDSLVCKKVD
jgi:hypothetical protein